MYHLFCHWYLFVVVCLLATENACPRLLQVEEIFLQDVTCLTSRSLLFSSTFTWSKESADSSDVTRFSEGVIWTSFSCSASSLFADYVTNPSSQLQVTVTQINIPVLCIVLVTFLPSPSEGHSDLIPNPLSAHHASNVHDNPQTYCLSQGSISYDFQRADPGLPADYWNPPVSLPSWGMTHHRIWMCVSQPLLSLPFIFQPLWRYSPSSLFKISPSRSGSSATKVAHKLVLETPVWYLFGSGSESLILMISFYLLSRPPENFSLISNLTAEGWTELLF